MAKAKSKKKPDQATKLNREQLSVLLWTYATKKNLIYNIVSKNRGGIKERVFNAPDVQGLINEAIRKVVEKVDAYRAERANGSPADRKFEDIPLIIRYFDKSLENLLKDVANAAGAQKRSRYKESLTPFTNEEGMSDMKYGSWDEVSEREKSDLINDIEFQLAGIFADDPNPDSVKLIKLFSLQFRDGIIDEQTLANSLSTDASLVLRENIPSLRMQLNRILSTSCKEAVSELFKIFRDNKSDWDIKQDEVKAANKSHLEAEKVAENEDLKFNDIDATTDTSFSCLKNRDVNGGFVAKVVVQILRSSNGVKKVAEVVKVFEKNFTNREDAMNYRKSISLEIKIAESTAKKRCEERKKRALEVFSYKVAS